MPALAAPATNNLPIQNTSFVGRDAEIEAVKEMLGESRLVTLTGAGGAGKTRLALEVASRVVDQFSEGVWLVELATMDLPELVDAAVLKTLSLTAEADRSALETLVEVLGCETASRPPRQLRTPDWGVRQTRRRGAHSLLRGDVSQHQPRAASAWTLSSSTGFHLSRFPPQRVPHPWESFRTTAPFSSSPNELERTIAPLPSTTKTPPWSSPSATVSTGSRLPLNWPPPDSDPCPFRTSTTASRTVSGYSRVGRGLDFLASRRSAPLSTGPMTC